VKRSGYRLSLRQIAIEWLLDLWGPAPAFTGDKSQAEQACLEEFGAIGAAAPANRRFPDRGLSL